MKFLKEHIPHRINIDCKNPYEILGVDEDATEREIKKAYKSLALEFHTDNPNTGNDKVFRLINLSKRILLDPALKAQYDEYYIFDEDCHSTDDYITEQALGDISKAFFQCLSAAGTENINMEASILQVFLTSKVTNKDHIIQRQDAITRLKRVKERTRENKVSSLIYLSLDASTEAAKQEIAKLKQNSYVLEKGIQLLKGFKYKYNKPKPVNQGTSSTSMIFTFRV